MHKRSIRRSKTIRKHSRKYSKKHHSKKYSKTHNSKHHSRKHSKKHSKCKLYLQKKIAINLNEFYKGRFTSPAQAIAVSYNEVQKRHPACVRILRKK